MRPMYRGIPGRTYGGARLLVGSSSILAYTFPLRSDAFGLGDTSPGVEGVLKSPQTGHRLALRLCPCLRNIGDLKTDNALRKGCT